MFISNQNFTQISQIFWQKVIISFQNLCEKTNSMVLVPKFCHKIIFRRHDIQTKPSHAPTKSGNFFPPIVNSSVLEEKGVNKLKFYCAQLKYNGQDYSNHGLQKEEGQVNMSPGSSKSGRLAFGEGWFDQGLQKEDGWVNKSPGNSGDGMPGERAHSKSRYELTSPQGHVHVPT